MKTINSRRSHLRRPAWLTLLVGCWTASLAAIRAAQPSLQPLVQPGQWPAWPRGEANDVKVVGGYAYVALDDIGLSVLDVSIPAHPVPVGGYITGGDAYGVAVRAITPTWRTAVQACK